MERLIMKDLLRWKASKYRKPLILKGARQTGKTWLLKEFGRRHYDNTAYFNFDEHGGYRQFFETTRDVHRIFQNLMMASGQTVRPGTTLVVFDEIQGCPGALNALKYICENAPEHHVACAGPLLGNALSRPAPITVGKTDFLEAYIHLQGGQGRRSGQGMRTRCNGCATRAWHTRCSAAPRPASWFPPMTTSPPSSSI